MFTWINFFVSCLLIVCLFLFSKIWKFEWLLCNVFLFTRHR
jgi:hypothetical protein